MVTKSFIQNILDGSPLLTTTDDKEAPIFISHTIDNPKLLIVCGENATGKSVVRKIITSRGRKQDVEVIALSQAGRCRSGVESLFVYGNEEEDSTGANTAQMIHSAFKTCRARKIDHMVIFDEPDIGLSESFAAGAGKEIAEFCEDLPEKTKMVIVISHRKKLLEQFQPLNPSFFLLDKTKRSFSEWLMEEPPPSPLSLLIKKNTEMYKKVERFRNSNIQR